MLLRCKKVTKPSEEKDSPHSPDFDFEDFKFDVSSSGEESSKDGTAKAKAEPKKSGTSNHQNGSNDKLPVVIKEVDFIFSSKHAFNLNLITNKNKSEKIKQSKSKSANIDICNSNQNITVVSSSAGSSENLESFENKNDNQHKKISANIDSCNSNQNNTVVSSSAGSSENIKSDENKHDNQHKKMSANIDSCNSNQTKTFEFSSSGSSENFKSNTKENKNNNQSKELSGQIDSRNSIKNKILESHKSNENLKSDASENKNNTQPKRLSDNIHGCDPNQNNLVGNSDDKSFFEQILKKRLKKITKVKEMMFEKANINSFSESCYEGHKNEVEGVIDPIEKELPNKNQCVDNLNDIPTKDCGSVKEDSLNHNLLKETVCSDAFSDNVENEARNVTKSKKRTHEEEQDTTVEDFTVNEAEVHDSNKEKHNEVTKTQEIISPSLSENLDSTNNMAGEFATNIGSSSSESAFKGCEKETNDLQHDVLDKTDLVENIPKSSQLEEEQDKYPYPTASKCLENIRSEAIKPLKIIAMDQMQKLLSKNGYQDLVGSFLKEQDHSNRQSMSGGFATNNRNNLSISTFNCCEKESVTTSKDLKCSVLIETCSIVSKTKEDVHQEIQDSSVEKNPTEGILEENNSNISFVEEIKTKEPNGSIDNCDQNETVCNSDEESFFEKIFRNKFEHITKVNEMMIENGNNVSKFVFLGSKILVKGLIDSEELEMHRDNQCVNNLSDIRLKDCSNGKKDNLNDSILKETVCSDASSDNIKRNVVNVTKKKPGPRKKKQCTIGKDFNDKAKANKDQQKKDGKKQKSVSKSLKTKRSYKKSVFSKVDTAVEMKDKSENMGSTNSLGIDFATKNGSYLSDSISKNSEKGIINKSSNLYRGDLHNNMQIDPCSKDNEKVENVTKSKKRLHDEEQYATLTGVTTSKDSKNGRRKAIKISEKHKEKFSDKSLCVQNVQDNLDENSSTSSSGSSYTDYKEAIVLKLPLQLNIKRSPLKNPASPKKAVIENLSDISASFCRIEAVTSLQHTSLDKDFVISSNDNLHFNHTPKVMDHYDLYTINTDKKVDVGNISVKNCSPASTQITFSLIEKQKCFSQANSDYYSDFSYNHAINHNYLQPHCLSNNTFKNTSIIRNSALNQDRSLDKTSTTVPIIKAHKSSPSKKYLHNEFNLYTEGSEKLVIPPNVTPLFKSHIKDTNQLSVRDDGALFLNWKKTSF